jgi:diaminobutyrate-2-oxoglutarate transaminase
MEIFKRLESEVRSYIRSFPVVFKKAKGAFIYDEEGKKYIDFFAGAGTLNYGHNNPKISKALIEHLQNDGIVHSLDKATEAKKRFLQKFDSTILRPRGMDYKVQFPGPTGTNAVETALKLARMVQGRSNVISFTNGFHGMTMGSLAVTGNTFYRDEAFMTRSNVAFMPYDGYFGNGVNTIEYIRKFLDDPSSGVDKPAAMILETVQAEGGVNVASYEWLVEIQKLCHEYGILFIVDDIQVGNGRTGTFFSFERAGIQPDIITLSKSIGGGLPLSLVLIKPELDQWKPGEHTGTFRGNNLAFVASAEALTYWDDDQLAGEVDAKSLILKERLEAIRDKFPQLNASVRGRGLIYGLQIPIAEMASEISTAAFHRGLIIELAGARDDVVKFLPSLTIEEDVLKQGLDIIEDSIAHVIENWGL